MIDIKLFLTLLLNNIAAGVETAPAPLGIIVVGIIEAPVLILLIASMTIKPSSTKITGLFIGWLILVFGVFLGGVFLLSFLFSFFY